MLFMCEMIDFRINHASFICLQYALLLIFIKIVLHFIINCAVYLNLTYSRLCNKKETLVIIAPFFHMFPSQI